MIREIGINFYITGISDITVHKLAERSLNGNRDVQYDIIVLSEETNNGAIAHCSSHCTSYLFRICHCTNKYVVLHTYIVLIPFCRHATVVVSTKSVPLPLPLESEAQRRKDHHGLFRPFLLKHESSKADGDKNTKGMGDDPK